MKLTDNVTVRKIAGQYCVLPVGQRVINSTSIMRTNECGGMLLEALTAEQTEDSLAEMMFAKFGAETDEDKATCRRDLAAFLQQVENAGILVK